MDTVSGGELLVRSLLACGVRTVFTLHGGHLDAAYRAAHDSELELVDTRHEQAAGLAAIGWALTTGSPGVVMVTAGGGVTNVVTAVASAYADAVPLVVLGGAPPLRDVDTIPVNSGGYDPLLLMQGITKWAHRITTTDELSRLVVRAFEIASNGRPGPVYLDLPTDVLFAQVDAGATGPIAPPSAPEGPAPTESVTRRVLEQLRAAKRPVILAGGGVMRAEAWGLLESFARATGTPVLTNNKGRGALPMTDPLWCGGFSSLAAAVKRGSEPSDLVIMLGARFSQYTGGLRTSVVPDGASVIQVDVHAEEFGRLRKPDLAIVADIREMLSALLSGLDGREWPSRSDWIDVLSPRRGSPTALQEAGPSISPRQLTRVVSEVAQACGSATILVADGGETSAWLDAATVTQAPRTWIGHGYLGLIGEGMPLAVGAQVARPESRVIGVVGDGAVGFNFVEFDTMVRHRLPIVVVVNNDGLWSMSAHGQDLIWGEGRRVVSELRRPRYDIAASGLGAHGEHVTHLDDLRPALERALASGLPACVNVETEATEVASITRRLMGSAADGAVSPDGRTRIPYTDALEI